MPIKNYTTKVPAVQTVGEIQGLLAAHGARKVMMDYGDDGKVLAVTFALDCCGMLRGFRLEAKPDGVKNKVRPRAGRAHCLEKRQRLDCSANRLSGDRAGHHG